MKLRKEVEIDVLHDEVDELMFEASAFDKLCLIIRLAKTIGQKDLEEIARFMGTVNLQKAAKPIKELHDCIMKLENVGPAERYESWNEFSGKIFLPPDKDIDINEVVKQLREAETRFYYARKGMGIYPPKDAWENLKKHCQQLSQWIEHGDVTAVIKPELVKILFAAEKLLQDNKI